MRDSFYHHEGSDTVNGRVTEVSATAFFPRIPGDDCGCKRSFRLDKGAFAINVVKLCEKHGREPGIIRYMLER